MNTLLKERVRSTNSKNKDTIYLKNIAEERVSSQEKLINSLKDLKDVRNKEKRVKYKANETKVKEKEKQKQYKITEKTKLEKECSGIETFRDALQSLRDKQTQTKTELKRLTKEIKFLETHDECPTCTQVISDTFKETRMGSLTSTGVSLTNDGKDYEENIKDTLDIIDELERICSELYEMRSEISSLDRDIIRLEKENMDIDKEITQQKSPKIDEEKNILEDLTSELKKVQDECSGISKLMDEYQVVSSLLKDSGIKKQVIKKYIPVFNNLINKYLHTMDFFVNFTLDEEFNEVIKSRFRDEFSYSSFSEGEKQKIDLALLFTWREVARMKNSAATNLLILDEVFDSSLDASATGELLSILLKLGGETNLFVISHKGDILMDKFKRCLRFEKINDFSKLIEEE
tara:strand:+ start:1 stop:1212 length:1212 start_codon:yes stop_codon:yes gene_type:complete